jgi:hypothetical protein
VNAEHLLNAFEKTLLLMRDRGFYDRSFGPGVVWQLAPLFHGSCLTASGARPTKTHGSRCLPPSAEGFGCDRQPFASER